MIVTFSAHLPLTIDYTKMYEWDQKKVVFNTSDVCMDIIMGCRSSDA